MGTWGIELWDQTEAVDKHTQQSVELFDKCSSMLKERIRIEQDYAKSLRRLTKQYSLKKKDDEQQQLPFTFQRSYKSFLEKMEELANLKDSMAEKMSSSIVKEMQMMSADAKVQRKKSLHKLSDCRNQLDHQFKALVAAKKRYDQASEESQQALKIYEAAEQSLDQTRVQILKHQKTSQEKGSHATRCCEEYKNCIGSYNDRQALYFSVELPQLIDVEFQQTYEHRINKLSLFLSTFVDIESDSSSAVILCLDSMADAARMCKPSEDVGTLIHQHKTGASPPQNIEFEEYGGKCSPRGSLTGCSSPRGPHAGGSSPRGSLVSIGGRSSPKASPVRALAVKRPSMASLWKSVKKDGNDAPKDYSHLPPAQRKKKLTKAITSVQEQLNQVEETKSGVEKLRETNEKFNNCGGDFVSVIGTYERELERLKHLVEHYQNDLTSLIDAESARKGNSLSRGSLRDSQRGATLGSPIDSPRDSPPNSPNSGVPAAANYATSGNEPVPSDTGHCDTPLVTRTNELLRESSERSPPDSIDFPPPPFDSLSLFPPPPTEAPPSDLPVEPPADFNDLPAAPPYEPSHDSTDGSDAINEPCDPTYDYPPVEGDYPQADYPSADYPPADYPPADYPAVDYPLTESQTLTEIPVTDSLTEDPTYDCPPCEDHPPIDPPVDYPITAGDPSVDNDSLQILSSPDLSPDFHDEEFEVGCRVLYDFNGSTEEELSVCEGELLVVLDEDDGSGWTRVQREGDGEGVWGFVPTSYVEWMS